MANNLDPENGNLPGHYVKQGPEMEGNGRLPARELWQRPPAPQVQGIPNAALIYGVSAAALFAFALYNLFGGFWVTGFLLLLPAVAFFGFALHFLRHPDQ